MSRKSLLPATVAALLSMFTAQMAFGTDCEKYLFLNGQRTSYSQIARHMGIRFLIARLAPPRFFELAQAARNSGGQVSLDARATGKFSENGAPIPEASRYNHAMLPLLDRHGGTKWVHHLMSDHVQSSAGVRSIRAEDWKVGLVFPVELLDRYHFTITDQSRLDYMIKAFRSGRGHTEYSSTQPSPADFENSLRKALKEPFPQNFDVSKVFEFHFEEPVPLSELALVWIPDPLLVAMTTETRGKDFRVRVSALSSQIPRWNDAAGSWAQSADNPEWIHLPPPTQDDGQWFDPRARSGRWFNTMPDWEFVENALLTLSAQKHSR